MKFINVSHNCAHDLLFHADVWKLIPVEMSMNLTPKSVSQKQIVIALACHHDQTRNKQTREIKSEEVDETCRACNFAKP